MAVYDQKGHRELCLAMQDIDLLICPVCGAPYVQAGMMLSCANAHTFDIAKEGYVNLLLKKQPGDNREMLQKRRNFFDHGYYHPLSDALNELVLVHLPEEFRERGAPPLHVLDAGCGEGYYLGRLHAFLAESGYAAHCIGLDISKEAIRMAARRYKEAFFIVANLKESLAIKDNALQVMLNIFAPRNAAEYARVLAPQGLLLVIIPGPGHLLELRSALHLLKIEENKEQHVMEQFAEQFSFVTTTMVAYPLCLQREEISQVVMMSPNYWHMSDEIRQAIEHMEEIETAVECMCLVLRRR